MMRERTSLARSANALLLVTVVCFAGCTRPKFAARPECPQGGHWSGVFGDTLNGKFGKISGGQLALSIGITDIVEFHDCQQFIVVDSNSGGARYSSLFAIFARRNLDSSYTEPVELSRRYRDRTRGVPYDSLTMGTPMATILSYDSMYVALGLKPNFNCLYFFRSGTSGQPAYDAQIVPVNLDQGACAVALRQRDNSATTLAVHVLPTQNATWGTAPPVARWDWDAANHTQYIGIRCGTAWCEVHPPEKTGYAFTSSLPLRDDPSMAKGWYDEQVLAVAHEKLGMPDEVSTITGTIIPVEYRDPESRKIDPTVFSNQWSVVAHVGIKGNPGHYTSKLNLIQTNQDHAQNEVSLCFVANLSDNQCVPASAKIPGCTAKVGWFSRIVHSSDQQPSDTSYFCVTRRDHDDPDTPPVPNAPRWRWAVDDETMWVACYSGCCEVKAR